MRTMPEAALRLSRPDCVLPLPQIAAFLARLDSSQMAERPQTISDAIKPLWLTIRKITVALEALLRGTA